MRVSNTIEGPDRIEQRGDSYPDQRPDGAQRVRSQQVGKVAAQLCVPSRAGQWAWGFFAWPNMQPMLSAGVAPMSEAYGVGAKQALAPLTEGRAAPLGTAHAKSVEPQAATGGAPLGSQAQVNLRKDVLHHTGRSCSTGTAISCLSAWLARGADSMGQGSGASGCHEPCSRCWGQCSEELEADAQRSLQGPTGLQTDDGRLSVPAWHSGGRHKHVCMKQAVCIRGTWYSIPSGDCQHCNMLNDPEAHPCNAV